MDLKMGAMAAIPCDYIYKVSLPLPPCTCRRGILRTMGTKARQLHIFFFPMMTAGHLIPTVDLAKLFARRGVRASIVTTTSNAQAVEASLARARESSGHHVELLLIEFPAADAGLPEGCDNIASLNSPDLQVRCLASTAVLRRPFERLLREHRPDAVVTDMFFPWTAHVAEEFGVPRLVFTGTGLFPIVVSEVVDRYAQQESLRDGDERFTIPGLPHRIELSKNQILNPGKAGPVLTDVFIKIKESEEKTYGVVVNSFHEMEPDYADHYRNVLPGKKAWHVGPVSLCNEEAVEMAARGGRAAVDHPSCLSWLATKAPSSVLYVCFGSMFGFTTTQLREIALGLEVSGHPFVWVIRNAGEGDPSAWLPEGFEETTAGTGRGVIIRGWAPQIVVLNHEAVGGFVTHCGWNSTLESITAGVPMVTWPLYADQFYNERLLVDVLRIGVPVGATLSTPWEKDRPLLKAEQIARAVDLLMGSGQEADGMRRRARELKAASRRAVEEGGSSYDDMGLLIRELSEKQTLPRPAGRD